MRTVVPYLFITSPKFHPDTVWNDIIRRGSGSIYTSFRMNGDFPSPTEDLTCVMRIAYLCPYIYQLITVYLYIYLYISSATTVSLSPVEGGLADVS